MTVSTALVSSAASALEHVQHRELSREQVDLIKRTICQGASDDELALFVNTANRLGLDPFARQIHAVKRWDGRAKREVMAIQVGIDGFRVAAGRTGELDGQEGPFWCGDDGEWHDVWLKKDAPRASKVLVFRRGCSRPFVGVATYDSYVQRTKDGHPNAMWTRGPDFMLAKCAEAVALRKAFPERLSGTYTPEEMGADDREAAPAAPAVGPMPPQSSHVAPTKPAANDSKATSRVVDAKSVETPAAMTDQECGELIAEIGKLRSRPDIGRFWNERLKHESKRASRAQYEQLSAAFEKQQDLIDDSAAQEQGQ